MTRLEEASLPDAQPVDSFEHRWAVWQSRGRVREARTTVRIRAVTIAGGFLVGVVVIVLWLVSDV